MGPDACALPATTTMSKRGLDTEEQGYGRKLPRGLESEAAGPSSSEKVLGSVDDSVESVTDTNSIDNTPKKQRGAGQKRGRSWNREEEILLMDSWNEVAERGLKSKDIMEEIEKIFHRMAVAKWGEGEQTTIHALDRKGGSLLARAKGLIRQFSDIVAFARKHTSAKNFPLGLSDEELMKMQHEINAKRSANNQDLFRSWHVRDALIYNHTHFIKSSTGETPKVSHKRKSYPQDGSSQQADVERQKLELEKERFKEGQRATTLDSLHKLLSTLDHDDESVPVIRQQILRLNTII